MIVAGASAYPRVIDFAKLREFADEIGALLFVDMAHIAGLVAAVCIPVPYLCGLCYPTTHRTLRGPAAVSSSAKRNGLKNRSAVFPASREAVDARNCGQGSLFSGSLQPAFNNTSCKCGQCSSIGAGINCAWLAVGFGGTDNHLMLVT
jgi:glycine hydroxymethyltransferase